MKAQKHSERSRRQPLGKALLRGGVMLVLAAGIHAVVLLPCMGQGAPKPDPAGLGTGDKTTAVDAGGNAFVVAPSVPTLMRQFSRS